MCCACAWYFSGTCQCIRLRIQNESESQSWCACRKWCTVHYNDVTFYHSKSCYSYGCYHQRAVYTIFKLNCVLAHFIAVILLHAVVWLKWNEDENTATNGLSEMEAKICFAENVESEHVTLMLKQWHRILMMLKSSSSQMPRSTITVPARIPLKCNLRKRYMHLCHFAVIFSIVMSTNVAWSSTNGPINQVKDEDQIRFIWWF